jgi:hypothetical protein
VNLSGVSLSVCIYVCAHKYVLTKKVLFSIMLPYCSSYHKAFCISLLVTDRNLPIF